MNKAKTYFIITFGCQSNKSDSERIAGDYEARGYSRAKNWQTASEIVINTCAIRRKAEDRVHGLLQNIIKYFKVKKLARPKIILTGCMLHHGKGKIYEIFPMVDEILPVNEVGFNSPVIRHDSKHAWVPISTGCNSFCTYCIVPYSRGREKSRPFKEIMTEVKELVKQGYSEITLLGMNVNSWGLEKVGVGLRKMLMSAQVDLNQIPSNQSQYLKPKGVPPFVKLLRAISEFNEIKIIRFLSSNPWDFHDELIEEIGKNKKIDRYVHLPIQSGSESVLRRMNRGYTPEKYEQIIKKLLKLDQNIEIGTDIIVGFPGETEAEFQETVEFSKKMPWKIAFVAQYSPRPGTVSAKLFTDDVPHKIKKQRWEILDELINKRNLADRPKVV